MYLSIRTKSNYACVSIGVLTLWFSYDTVIAFSTSHGCKCRINNWGPTTAKHLNWIEPDHSKRIPSKHFEKELTKVLKKHKLTE